MTKEIQFFVEEDGGFYQIDDISSGQVDGFIEEGVFGYSEYMFAREEAALAGRDVADHPTRYDLIEDYLSKKLVSTFANGEKPSSPYIRWSELGKAREKALDALADDDTDVLEKLDVFNMRALYYEEFFNNLKICVEEI